MAGRLAAALLAVALVLGAGWFLLRAPKAPAVVGPGPAAVEPPAVGTGGAPPVAPEVGRHEELGTAEHPDDGSDIRDPEGPEGGADAEDILAAGAKGTAQGWLEVRRLLAINGSADPRVTEMLLKSLADDRFRMSAAELARYLKDPAALQRFLDAAKGTGNENTRAAAIMACGHLGGPGVLEAAAELLRGAKPGSILASSAASALGTLGTPEAARVLVDALRAAVGTPGAAVFVEVLHDIHAPAALEEIGRLAVDEATDPRLRASLVQAMGQTRDPAVVADLLKIARGSEDESLRQEAFAALGMVGAPDAVQALLDVVHGGDDAEKLAAAAALQNVRNHAAAPAIDDALSKPLPEELIGYMVTALGKCGTKENVPTLSRIARDGGETEGIRLTAVKAMGEIGDASAAPAVLEYTEQATDANSRSQSVDALSKVARPEDVTRIQKLLDASPENSRDRYILQGLVERLKKGILTPGRPR